MSLETDLLAIDKALWTGGPEAYRRHCDEQCLVVFTGMAGVMAREEIAKTAEEGRWTKVALEPKGFVRLDEDACTIAYECHAVRKDGKPHAALVTSDYVKRADGWKLASHHQTEIPQKS